MSVATSVRPPAIGSSDPAARAMEFRIRTRPSLRTYLSRLVQHGVTCVERFAPICDDSSGVGDCGFPRWLLENGPYRPRLQFRLHAPADSQRRIDADVADGS